MKPYQTRVSFVAGTQIIYPEIQPNFSRRRRDATNKEEAEDLSIRFEAFGEPFHARLKLNNDLLTPNTLAQVIGDKGRILHEQDVTNCYYTGRLVNDPATVVSLANCDGLVRFLIDIIGTKYYTLHITYIRH